MSLTREQGPTNGYDHRSPSSEMFQMESAGRIYKGTDGQLRVEMVKRIIIKSDGQKLIRYEDSELLHKACERAAEEADVGLRKRYIDVIGVNLPMIFPGRVERI